MTGGITQKKVYVKAFKVDAEAIIPAYSTEDAACFDIFACIKNCVIKTYNSSNIIATAETLADNPAGIFEVRIKPGNRCLIPTGIIFDIPKGYSIRLHPRSGLSLKKGIVLGNCEGVIDSDYVDPTFVMIQNNSSETFVINHGDRICQGEVVPVYKAMFIDIDKAPLKKTDRDGGFGSTGV